MKPKQEEALDILVEVAKALLNEVEDVGDLGYHLDVDEYAGQLRKALKLFGEPCPEEPRWKVKYEIDRMAR